MTAETFLIAFLAFLTVAVLVAFVATKVRVPYTIAMVLVGLGAGVFAFRSGTQRHPAQFPQRELPRRETPGDRGAMHEGSSHAKT